MKKRNPHWNLKLVGYGFVAPAFIIIAVMILYPIIKSMMMSVTEWYMLSGKTGHPFVGFNNFRDVLYAGNAEKMGIMTVLYTVIGVLGKMSVGLGVALLLNGKFKGRTILRGIVVIPWAIPAVVVATVFLIALDPVFGIINNFLISLGIIDKGILFLSVPRLAIATVILIAVWRYFPFVTLMLLAGLQGIPKELYEVASIDGAGNIRKFIHITWPLLQPVWSIVLILQIMWTIREFDLVYLVTQGGPGSATQVIGVDIYLNAFRFLKMGTAAAESAFLTLISLVFGFLYFRAVRKGGQLS